NRTMWRVATELVDREAPGAFNQALMELGALVCRPQQPTCTQCPWSTHCLALREDTVESLPTPRKRPERHRVVAAGMIIERDDAVLLVRRPEDGLLGGLWALPSLELLHRKRSKRADDEGAFFGEQVQSRLRAWALAELGLSLTTVRPL